MLNVRMPYMSGSRSDLYDDIVPLVLLPYRIVTKRPEQPLCLYPPPVQGLRQEGYAAYNCTNVN